MNALLIPIILSAAAIPVPLTIGSPSPKLAALTFVRGDAVKELSKGTVYVVEFSGTQCGPCLKCVPHLNELQKKYSDVVFLSVYGGEDEKVVREFLEGPGKDIAFRVAADPAGAMWRDWSKPACREGIPDAFLVGKDGKIAWIGRPWEIADPLDQIVAGTFDPQEDVMRLNVEQAIVLRARRAEEREKKGHREYNRINELIIAGKLDAALADTEKALVLFSDSPATTNLLRDARLYLLANLPGRREEAFRLATELAVEAKTRRNSDAMIGTASTLLNAAEGAALGARDKRLINLALALLRDPSLGDQMIGKEHLLGYDQIDKQQLLGSAYHLRGDATRAAAAIREALAMVRNQKPPAGADEAQFAESIKQRLSVLEATLKEYSEKVPPASGDRG
jgi:tetratricopeptide (TPR) repeat protein